MSEKACPPKAETNCSTDLPNCPHLASVVEIRPIPGNPSHNPTRVCGISGIRCADGIPSYTDARRSIRIRNGYPLVVLTTGRTSG